MRKLRLHVSVMGLAVWLCAVVPPGASFAQGSTSSGNVPKQVHLVADSGRILASNVRLNRFDELKLGAQERVREQKAGEGVAIVVTNQRLIAYGVLSGWRAIDRSPNEQIESVSAEDYAVLIVTSHRMLNFNGESGAWGEQRRAVSR
jgi:hypothetical protein